MPQETNLNISPYHDDFDPSKNFHRILFKPGTPVQARELTGLQSILQDQIEKFGTHFFKEGSKVIPGQLSYLDVFPGICIESSYLGIPVSLYASQLVGRTIRGQNSGVEARIEYVLSDAESERNLFTLYFNVTKSGSDFSTGLFQDGETLILLETISYGNTTISANQGFANTVSIESNVQGSAANIQSGVYFLRGNFVTINPQTIILSQYSPTPTVKVGLTVVEEIINADEDPSLNDNAQGFSNYSAPGADRLKITASLTSKLIIDNDDPSFVELMRIQNGELETFVENTDYNYIKSEFARRTYDESGDYYIKSFDVSVKNTLNNYLGNDGIYNEGDFTYQGNTPSDSLMEYIISSGKAYVRGFEVNKQTDTVIDIEKPRSTRQVFAEAVPLSIGPKIAINNIHGSPVVGFGTTIAAILRDERVGVASTAPSGNAIGECRIYDYNLESQVFSGPESEYTLRLFDISPYTKLEVTQPFISLRSGAFVEGKYSGASGFVVEDSSGISTFSLRQVRGTFNRGEKLVVDGIDYNTTVSISTNYDISNVKSIYQGTSVGISTFNADLKLTTKSRFSTPLTISAVSGNPGVSTISAPQGTFVGIITSNDLVRFNATGVSSPVVLKVQAIGLGGTTLTLAGIQTVTNVVDGAPPSTTQTITNLEVVSGNLVNVEDNSLFTRLNQNNIDSVDLGASDIIIKKTFNNVSSASSALSLPTAPDNEFYLPFDEERYHVAYNDGTIEPLTSDKVQVASNAKNVTITGLSRSSESNIRVSAVLNKNKVVEKKKLLRNVSSIVVSRSSNPASGIGSTTLGDGLTYSNVYGTRVQDKEISLNKPDILRILGVFESDDANDPNLPSVTITSISGPSQSTSDFIIGEKIIGSSTKAVARVVSALSSTQFEVVYLNEKVFSLGESIIGETSKIGSVCANIGPSDKNVTNDYILDNGQRSSFYDYGRIVLKKGRSQPKRRLRVIFQNFDVPPSDTGDIFTSESYDNELYSNDIPSFEGIRNTDILDIRPRVGEYSLNSTRSPFDFASRNFTESGQSISNILVSDENIVLNYQYYLGRIDKIYLDSNGKFNVVSGVPSENPQIPADLDGNLEVATISLPPYLFSLDSIQIKRTEHKRYTMKDIGNLDTRITNLEYYTALSLLEKETEALTIQDARGFDRFKSGFFVDNFKTHIIQDQSNPDFSCSIDTYNNELRPSHFTTSLDLILATTAISGIGASVPSTRDSRFNDEVIDPNLRKTGDLLTLNYADLILMQNIFASRVESVNPFLVTKWMGSLTLYPSSDIWVDQKIIKTNEFDAQGPDFMASVQRLGINEASGFAEIEWGSWVDTVTGRDTRTSDTTQVITSTKQLNATDDIRTTTTQTVRTTTEVQLHQLTREGVAIRTTPHIEKVNVGNKVLNRTNITFMRSRNIEFRGTRMRPGTQVYPVLDNVGMIDYVCPKLLEIQMTSGTFQVGETVTGTMLNDIPDIDITPGGILPSFRFRVAYANHKDGPYDLPTSLFASNPYNADFTLPDEYSSTSSVLNVDTTSLSATTSGEFFGYPRQGMILKGLASGAQATVSNIRLITDEVGTVIGSLFIPDPSAPSNPQFTTGVKIVKLTSLPTVNFISSLNSTAAEATFPATGILEFTEENIVSLRSNAIHKSIFQESTSSETILGSSSAVISEVSQDTILTNVRQRPAANCDARYVAYTTAINNGYSSYTAYARAVGDYEANLIYNTAVLLTRPGAPRECGASSPASSTNRSSRATNTRRFTSTGRSSRGGRIYNFDSSGRLIATANLGSTRTLYTSTRISGTSSRSYRSSSSSSSRGGGSSGGGRSYNFDSSGKLIPTARLGSTNTAFTSNCSSGRDPLAQSFFINSAEGAFITAIEVFFQAKDEVLPVTMQIRTMRDGTPTTSVVPFSELDLMPSEVNISDDASVPTKFTFKSPVYLKGNTEYAFVLLADTPNYGAWISRMGEEDVTNSLSNPDAPRSIISQQPLLGSLFKSQNGSTWDASQFEDIKFTMYRAQFTTNTRANASFYNPVLSLGNGGVIKLGENPIEVLSKRAIIGLASTLSSSQEATVVQGLNISQVNNITASGIVIDTFGAIGLGNSVGIINAGIGYTPSTGIATYSNVSLTTLSGNGRNATASITVNNGGITSCYITNGGTGYSVGDELGITTLGSSSLGRNARLSVGIISAINAIEVDSIQGQFTTGSASTITYRDQSTGSVTVLTGITIDSITENSLYDGLHFNVRNRNHGMYSSSNVVRLANIRSDMRPTTIVANVDQTTTSNIAIANTSKFETFENVGVGTTNPGYALLGNEVISYTGVSGSELTGISRNIDNSGSFLHNAGEYITKYELNGISLRRINKTHTLGDATVENARELDNFYVKVDTSTHGIDRSSNIGHPKLHFNSTKKVGGDTVTSTKNIQFETVTPNVQTLILPGTSLNASIRTTSATSVDGTEAPFVDLGYESISIDKPNDLSSPRIVSSKVNEDAILTDLPANKSFTFDLEFTTNNSFVSPAVDLDRVNMVFTSNRLNKPISDYTSNNLVTITGQDPHSAIYVTKKVDLSNPANSIKVMFSAYRHESADIRVLYKIFTNDANIDSVPYDLFPGYNNIDDLGNVIDKSNNDGLPNVYVTPSKPSEYKDYEFFVDDLPEFTAFSIKIVMSGTNQAQPPKIKDLRVIAVR